MNINMNKPYQKLVFIFLLSCLTGGEQVFAQAILSDPTRPALYAENIPVSANEIKNSEFKISQIYTGSKKTTAIINGKKVKSGDRIDNAEVIAIHPWGIDLMVDGEVKKVLISPSFKKHNLKNKK